MMGSGGAVANLRESLDLGGFSFELTRRFARLAARLFTLRAHGTARRLCPPPVLRRRAA